MDLLIWAATMLGRFQGSLNDPFAVMFYMAAFAAGLMGIRYWWLLLLLICAYVAVFVMFGFSGNDWRASAGVELYGPLNVLLTIESGFLYLALIYGLGWISRMSWTLIAFALRL